MTLRLAVGLVLVGALLAYLGVPYAGVLVVFGAIAFLFWIFNYEIGRIDR